jgi:hypothetical protein
MIMNRTPVPRPEPAQGEDLPGIIIRDTAREEGRLETMPRLPAFVYGESEPSVPVLPFGRWKVPG